MHSSDQVHVGLPSGGPFAWLSYWGRVSPERIAMAELGGATLSYADYLARVETCASELRHAGLEPDHAVTILCDSALEQRVWRTAVSACGGVDAVLDPRLSAAEVSLRNDLISPRIVVSRAGLQRRTAPATDACVQSVNRSSRLLFTTGSTGAPRAVLLSPRQLDSAAWSNLCARRLTGSDVLLSVLPVFHAAGALFEDSMLRAGGQIVLPAAGEFRTVRDSLARVPGTITTLLPSMLRSFSTTGFQALRTLRLINYAGEPIDPTLLGSLLHEYTGEVTRGYGLTEAGPLVSVLDNEAHRTRSPKISSIGRCAPGVSLRIAGADATAPGELLVSSPHVMVGYWRDPIATKQCLDDGWLRTGDLATSNGDEFELIGRLGERFRSGGEWIHPKEIEAVLGSLVNVVEVVVVSRASERWGRRPVAFVVLSSPLDVDQLRTVLAASLTKFKWPDWLEVLEQMPRVGPGKVDRAALERRAASPIEASRITLANAANA